MNNDIIEISDLEWDIKPSSSRGGNNELRSSNFGSGIELLMNDKVKENTRLSSDIDIEDLNNLENELNDLSIDLSGGSHNEKQSVHFNDSPSIGQSTAETNNANSKTWDGYGKFNNIPLNPDKSISSTPQIPKEEVLREKFKYLRKLEALEKKGIELSRKYNMESPLAEMQGEYETIMEEKSKSNSMKFQGNMLMAIVNGIEFLNNRFDPFDIKLDGWGEQINENVTDYDDIFGELYDKYKSRATMAPELKLLFQLGGSAMMVHMTNTMFKSAMPGMDDILRQNPDLMKQFQSAAVNSMSQTNPGLSGFMNGVMNPQQDNYSGSSGPPPPMATQGTNSIPTPLNRPGNNNYAEQPNFRPTRNNFVDDGINFRESKTNDIQQKYTRAEMKGPSDITDILAGLKTKTINIQEQTNQTELDNNSSTISISELKELQSGGNIPKRSKRRLKSDKNTISLDL
jgi:Family of unknown function (DUF5767)